VKPKTARAVVTAVADGKPVHTHLPGHAHRDLILFQASVIVGMHIVDRPAGPGQEFIRAASMGLEVLSDTEMWLRASILRLKMTKDLEVRACAASVQPVSFTRPLDLLVVCARVPCCVYALYGLCLWVV
jgi:hypothetical protein